MKKETYLLVLLLVVLPLSLTFSCDNDDDDDDDDADDDDTNDDDDDDDTDFQITEGFTHIFPGAFMMGSESDEPGHLDVELQLRDVVLTRHFEIMTTEVTQGQFESLTGVNPSEFSECGGDCPVNNVNWYHGLIFANLMSQEMGLAPCFQLAQITCMDKALDDDNYCLEHGGIREASVEFVNAKTIYECQGYRLPTEGEWEYATRAGTTTGLYSGDNVSEFECYYLDPILDQLAWYCGNSDDIIHTVGQKTPNNWGLYDPLGNVHEWVWDIWDAYIKEGLYVDPSGPEKSETEDNARTIKGGYFSSYAGDCRSAARLKLEAYSLYIPNGFRLVRTLGN